MAEAVALAFLDSPTSVSTKPRGRLVGVSDQVCTTQSYFTQKRYS